MVQKQGSTRTTHQGNNPASLAKNQSNHGLTRFEKEVEIVMDVCGFKHIAPPCRGSDGSLNYFIKGNNLFDSPYQVIRCTDKVVKKPDLEEFMQFIEKEQFPVGTLITNKRACATALKLAAQSRKVTILGEKEFQRKVKTLGYLGIDTFLKAWESGPYCDEQRPG